jgi:hypothetical protein
MRAPCWRASEATKPGNSDALSSDFTSVTVASLRSLVSTPLSLLAAAVHQHQRDVVGRACAVVEQALDGLVGQVLEPRTTTQRVLEKSDGAASSPSVARSGRRRGLGDLGLGVVRGPRRAP